MLSHTMHALTEPLSGLCAGESITGPMVERSFAGAWNLLRMIWPGYAPAAAIGARPQQLGPATIATNASEPRSRLEPRANLMNKATPIAECESPV